MVTGVLMINGLPVFLAIICGIASGLLIGLINGLIITRIKFHR